ncbi:Cell fate regulator YaaT, PSP1 superfamily (controls sporulation, competence, biofilm development) [Desulfacinum hydrothermale DSM 13146]|uniref:Cell fate regulator YaaT, PSP1 superfamily (Controls sporulation, competence, biofilm development) n=1 Tax=Desulfacinum hydrothermale DSM 13146 TaxID=1121390 RepID=A0A1W1XEB8_9BACT|nr:stage 0 sporulation family protein [Desulfacinum hydrothermale]SMC22276.1 Cell fate regulator YaaT, PSP1 superfamily (controls sporulation, competence, biofilm development) [Desulfacinum hydrothermale DSM 13146]
MEKVIGIRFRDGGKIYHFDPGPHPVQKGDYVVVNTEQGKGLGEVVEGPFPKNPDVHPKEIKPIERPAQPVEIERHFENLRFEEEAEAFCLERIQALGLAMNLVDVECFYDRSKIIFYFTADGRVDFRELVKDLVRRLRMRVELRQIGVRNQAKMVGGLGTCGRPLCCATFLRNFHPVSIKMAKEQNLSLNPSKISGACGRLMCCLQYEYDTYKYYKQGMPKLGKKVETPQGRGKVIRQNVIDRIVTVLLESGQAIDIEYGPVSEHGAARPCQANLCERRNDAAPSQKGNAQEKPKPSGSAKQDSGQKPRKKKSRSGRSRKKTKKKRAE